MKHCHIITTQLAHQHGPSTLKACGWCLVFLAHFFCTINKTLLKLKCTITTAMKTIEIDQYNVVKAGKNYVSENQVNVQQLMRAMEKNETYIFWLQPKDGDLNSQIACIQINGIYYSLNLKMEKIIFRHIRLTKNFINREKLEDGTPKLRIPQRLLKEKLRTALRAKQVTTFCIKVGLCINVY